MTGALLIAVLCLSAACDLQCGVAQMPTREAGCASAPGRLESGMDPATCAHCRHSRQDSNAPQQQQAPVNFGLHQPYEAASGIRLASPLVPAFAGRIAPANGSVHAWATAAWGFAVLGLALDVGNACCSVVHLSSHPAVPAPALPLRI